MKAYELIENMPNEINGLKKVVCNDGKEDYPFELNSDEEISFYKTLEIGHDDRQLLWYENDKKAYMLYVTLNEDNEVEFWFREMDVLWVDDDGENEYDGIDDTILFVVCFEEAVENFIKFLKEKC